MFSYFQYFFDQSKIKILFIFFNPFFDQFFIIRPQESRGVIKHFEYCKFWLSKHYFSSSNLHLISTLYKIRNQIFSLIFINLELCYLIKYDNFISLDFTINQQNLIPNIPVSKSYFQRF